MPPRRYKRNQKSKIPPNPPNDMCPVCHAMYSRTRHDKLYIEACPKCRESVWSEVKQLVREDDPHSAGICGLLGCHCWSEIFRQP